MYFRDIVIRIAEDLDEARIQELERELSRQEGVYEACMHESRRHLLMVDFDPDRLQPGDIVQRVRDRGLHAEMIVR